MTIKTRQVATNPKWRESGMCSARECAVTMPCRNQEGKLAGYSTSCALPSKRWRTRRTRRLRQSAADEADADCDRDAIGADKVACEAPAQAIAGTWRLARLCRPKR